MIYVAAFWAMIAVVIGEILGLGDFATIGMGVAVCIAIVCLEASKRSKELKALQQQNKKALRYDEKTKTLYVMHRHDTHAKRFTTSGLPGD